MSIFLMASPSAIHCAANEDCLVFHEPYIKPICNTYQPITRNLIFLSLWTAVLAFAAIMPSSKQSKIFFTKRIILSFICLYSKQAKQGISLPDLLNYFVEKGGWFMHYEIQIFRISYCFFLYLMLHRII